MKYSHFGLSCVLALVPWLLMAGNEGGQVVVVYNSSASGSKEVAEYYAARRNVPAKQVFGFPLSTNAEMSRMEFQDSLERPLAKGLEAAKLWKAGKPVGRNGAVAPAGTVRRVLDSKIRYLVLCYGVPYKIHPAPELLEHGADELKPELRRNEAAVDSELSWLPLLEPTPMLAGPMRNPLAATTNAADLHPTNGVLMVTRLDGPGVIVAKGLVDKALQAEREGLWGRAYVDLRSVSDPNYRLGDDMLRMAAQTCRLLGYETSVDTNAALFPASFPMSHIAFYAGWYTDNVSGPFARAEVEFMPGAFAYHLHSYSAGALRSTNHSWVGPLLARGAAASMGSVYEPYLSGTPDISIFTERFLYAGFTFGEAAYAAVSWLSWQTTMVGDPLYRPFARNPDALREEFERRGSSLAEWPYLRLLNINIVQGKPLETASVFLEDLELRKKSAVLTEKLADLYHLLGKPSSAIVTYERGLALTPSPQQRLRIRLALAERLAELGREQEAGEQLRRILEESPDYAARATLQARLEQMNSANHQTNSVAPPP
jgi:uncharacterized protein (TIGR03790 family)